MEEVMEDAGNPITPNKSRIGALCKRILILSTFT